MASKRYEKQRRKMTSFDESLMMNENTYRMYYNRLMALTISRFEWKGLPPTVDERFLEMTLFTDGQAIFFHDDTLGYLALQTMMNGGFDVYRRPINSRAYAVNGYQRELNNRNSVIIYNDVLRNNSMLDTQMYAQRMYELERTMDVNIKAQKTPVMIVCSEDQRLTMENLYMKYDGNQPFIFGDKKLDINGVTSLKTDAPLVADKLQVLKSDIWNEALTNLGIVNVNDDKKERLITTEVRSGQENVVAQRNIWLNARKQACEQINEMFGLNVSVDFRGTDINLGEDGEEVGEVHNASEDNL